MEERAEVTKANVVQ